MTLTKKFKEFFMKTDHDFDSPNINLINFHPRLYIYLAIMGIFTNNRESLIRFILPCLCILFIIVSIVLESLCVFHGITVKDYSLATECFLYCLVLGMVLVVYYGTLTNKDKILHLIEDMNNDFLFIRIMDFKYRNTFLRGQLLIHKLCCAWYLFSIIIGILYISLLIGSLVMHSLFGSLESDVRPLMFPIWLPAGDPYRTPNYEILLFIELCSLSITDHLFAGYISMLLHVLLHYYYILELITKDFEVIFDGLDETVTYLSPQHPIRMQAQYTLSSRMKRIVNWHLSVFKSVKTISSVFGPPIMYQVMFSGMGLCLVSYQIADKLENGNVDIIFIMLLVGGCYQLLVPCFLGTLLRDKGYAVGDACWNSDWYKTRLGILIRADMLLVIHRSQRPVTIKFIGLPQLQLETFSSIITTAYSYFNMLRKYNSDLRP
ncbi:odorant receptor 49b-like [Achroia grisella]|uniref:odorant receptor 49b-like n=1 Tax=Achroia grisella TaxID=688607 RepID=UPI0027D33D2B|nr:odorant receptor 49b-like [Achroia grisella]